METRADEISDLLAQTRDCDPRVRLRAVVHLCPCHVKRNKEQIWDRLLSMATDLDPKVRRAVLHGLTDGSPRSLEGKVVHVLEAMHGDSDQKVRRMARQILAHYRRTGELDIS